MRPYENYDPILRKTFKPLTYGTKIHNKLKTGE